MNSSGSFTQTASKSKAVAIRRPGLIQRFARRVLFSLLNRVVHGKLIVKDGQSQHVFGRTDANAKVRAVVTVHDPRFYTAIAFGGSIGSGKAYMAGYWSCDDLTALFRIVAKNKDVIDNIELGWARLQAPLYKKFAKARRNSRHGSRRNIAEHYDLGNDFYALFLDDTMAYSSGIFITRSSRLKEASIEKFDRICKKLAIGPKDHVLEIGTGWGGFALHAASRYGCRVTTTTISEKQFAFACRRIHDAGLSDKVMILKKDYRDLTGRYDKLVSIEMIEAVGHPYLDTFFKCCSDRLTENGMMLLQAITLPDQSYDLQLRTVDFIKRYIFPGSFIPSITAISNAMTRSTNLRLFHLEDISPHYATTLRLWRERFRENLTKVRELGFSESFIRMWEYYLCYCEGGFQERYLGDVQMLFVKPFCRRDPILPPIPSI
ncbi:MAG: cyclopropane-fatty-acyl-phospholipid synthase family protein [Desulfobacterales bacterium]|jgi:cyclopropane-fatty-acyl-phospholipid synthase|nr:cyclopropane-fatty-acyl-phospholipid synthase family protein [Desulfobacterales bacterium]